VSTQATIIIVVDPNSADGSIGLSFERRFAEMRRTQVDVEVALSIFWFA